MSSEAEKSKSQLYEARNRLEEEKGLVEFLDLRITDLLIGTDLVEWTIRCLLNKATSLVILLSVCMVN